MPAPTKPSLVTLDGYASLRMRGTDVLAFLQGQLSNDLQRLRAEATLLAGLHSPQGRTIALLRLVALAEDDLLALLPAELAGDIATRLRKYVLRAKVKIEDESAQWQIAGGWGHAPSDAQLAIPIAGARFLMVSARGAGAAASDATASWHAADIAEGQPQVYRATSEQFVGQMLNLDVVDAISFSKGCYTGQEVIARAHYRGRVKRRMQRFRTLLPMSLTPGDLRQLADGRGLRVVDAVQVEDGRCEFLAVAPLAAGVNTTDEQAGDEQRGGDALACEQLPLPYALPL